jgi:hypothetical protein
VKVHHLALADAPDAYDMLVRDSFFASRGFLEVWRTMGGRPVVWAAEVDGRIAAVIPGIELGFGPLARFASLPDGCYGGLFTAADLPDPVVAGDALMGAIAARRYARCHVFDAAGRLRLHRGFAAQSCATRVVPIDPDWVPPDPKLQSEIRKAEREGIRVERYDAARHESGFLELVRATPARQGAKPRYPVRLWQNLARLAETDARIRWRWCEHAGHPAAAHVYFVEGDSLVSWQDYSERSFSFLKPNQYIRWQACRDAARDGLRALNLGATPDEAHGVTFYKCRWGGEPHHYTAQVRWAGIGALVRKRDERRAAATASLATAPAH